MFSRNNGFNQSKSRSKKRHKTRVPVEFSALESRTYFDAVYPTPNEQYLLELINRARANDQAEVQRFVAANDWPTGWAQDVNESLPAGTITTAPIQPLAMNPFLLDAARKHTQYLFANPGTADPHSEVVNGVTLDYTARDQAAGYPVSTAGGENIWTISGDPNNDVLTTDMQNLEQGTFVDAVNGGTPGRGHRVNMLNPAANEVGVGLGTTTFTSAGITFPDYEVTEDFANAGQSSFLCGIAYNDLNADKFYEPGEELPGVTITATNTATNQTFTTTTWASGGYSLALAAGTYSVTATGANVGTPAPQVVTIAGQNVEGDFISTNSPAAAAPTISTQPQIQTVAVGANATFTVAANGNPPPTVQWQVEAPGQTTFSPVAGATGLSLTINSATAAMNGNQYEAVITNTQGTVTSNPATLTVNPAPTSVNLAITTYPSNQTGNAGDTVTFTSAGQGYSSIQWAVSSGGGAFTNLAGATNPTLTFVANPSQNGNTYQVNYYSATGGHWAGSALLTVNAAPTAPTVTAQPTNQVVPTGTLSSLTGGAALLPGQSISSPNGQYQLLYQTDGNLVLFRAGGGAIWASNTAGMTPGQAVMQGDGNLVVYGPTGAVYFASGTNGNNNAVLQLQNDGNLVINSAAGTQLWATNTAQVTPAMLRALRAAIKTATVGSTATLAVVYSGFPAPTVQWQQSASTGTAAFTDVPDATSPTLEVLTPAAGASVKYRAVITNANGSVTTQVVTVKGNKRSALSDDLTNLHTASAAALAAIAGCRNATNVAEANLSADLKRVKASAASKALLEKLAKDEQSARQVFTRSETALLNHLNALAIRISAEAARAKTNSTAAARLETDLSALTAAATNNAIPSDATACKVATTSQLTPISAVAPSDAKLQNDVATAETNAYNVSQALQAPLTMAALVVQQVQTDAKA